ncbi:MAG: hypothetical protein ACREQ9_26020 [Candidatus Binatia bacterium]
MGEAEADTAESLERLRRLVSWIAVSIFAATFVALLVLSGTGSWRPDNDWLFVLDRALRISGVVGLIVWLIPYLARLARWIGAVFSGGR